MKNHVGLWIDHKKAVVVFLTGSKPEIKLINSNIQRPQSQSGVEIPADDILQRLKTVHLNSFYDEVIASFRDAEKILIMGNGEAKGELIKRIELNNHNRCKINVETVDKMSDRQIVAKVRKHFQRSRLTVHD